MHTDPFPFLSSFSSHLHPHRSLSCIDSAPTTRIKSRVDATPRNSKKHNNHNPPQKKQVLGLPKHRIALQARRAGGGFGAKLTRSAQNAAAAAVCARKLGRAVRVSNDRTTDFVMVRWRRCLVLVVALFVGWPAVSCCVRACVWCWWWRCLWGDGLCHGAVALWGAVCLSVCCPGFFCFFLCFVGDAGGRSVGQGACIRIN